MTLPRVLLMAMGAVAALSGATSQETAADENLAALIAQLGADSFRQRELADQRILKVGESALPALRLTARTSRDPEIRFRAHRLAERILREACLSNRTGMKLVLIHVGEFQMGSPGKETSRRDDEHQHRVSITKAFLLGACEVTQSEYHQVMQTQPSWFRADGQGRAKVAGKSTDEFPVDSLTWFDAVEFCNRLSKLDGQSPYYRLHSVKREADKIIDAEVEVLGGLGYRLPTEAEWEYACRAGGAGPYHAVAGKSSMRGNFQYRQSVAYGSRSRIAGLGRSNKVASYPPNAWGLHDMHGNVAEWCWDWYDKGYYTASPGNDPQGPKQGVHRVLRGGSWLVQQSSCRSATRFWNVPTEGNYYTGFRVARDASPFLTAEQ